MEDISILLAASTYHNIYIYNNKLGEYIDKTGRFLPYFQIQSNNDNDFITYKHDAVDLFS